jgi:hypothetical protein
MVRHSFLFTLIALVAPSSLQAQATKPAATSEHNPLPIREIYVPFEDLNVILESDKHRAFLTRAEYDELVKLAKARPQAPAPHKVTLLAADYEGQLEEGRALITGQLQIEVLEDGLFALPLDLGGVGIRSALLDGQPAPLSRNEHRQPIVLVQGKGLHKLELKLVAPLQTAAAQQTLHITLPTNAASKLKLAVPGNVDVKGGAAVLSRSFDMAAGRTVLEILPQRGSMAVVMSLNNRLLQDQRVIVARSVIVDEVTQGYERIHATISYRVLHGAVDKLRIAVPAGFEVTKVESLLLARWEQKAENGRQVLEATLREATSEQIVLSLTANRSPAAIADWLGSLSDWRFPKLEPLDTAGSVAVIGLLVEDRLRPEQITPTSLIPIDSAALLGAIPESVLKAEPGAPAVRQVVAYYAPGPEYSLSARFIRPPAGLKVAGNSLLVIGDQGLTLQGGFALTPQAESLFQLSFTVPAGSQVTQVTGPDGSPLAIERYPDAGGTRVSVRLAKSIPVNQTQTVNYQAVSTPAGWLADWTTQKVEFPKVLIQGATNDSGALAAQTTDDLVVRPDQLTSLTPLLDNEKAAFGLGGITTALAYRYEDRDFAASLIVERTPPSLTAQGYSILRLERDNLVAYYELVYDVREARTRRVAFSLPIGTPAELTIRGLAGTAVKEFASKDDGQRRRWTVQLAERQIGEVRLAVEFTQRLPEAAQQNRPLPLVQAEDVEYQSALVAVEGDAELDVQVTTTAREVDIGELAGSQYSLDKLRRVIGTFGYVGTTAQVAATITRRDPYTLPPALIQRSELVTKVSASGVAQSVARYDIVTKATLLEIRLPIASTLWTVFLDNEPTKPQREGQSLLLSLPAQDRVQIRKLQIVYETPSARFGLSGTVDAVAPTLLVRAIGTDAEREVPQADLEWKLVLPSGYVVRRAGGTVFTDIPPRELPALRVAGVLYHLAGGYRPWYWAPVLSSKHQVGATPHYDFHDHAEATTAAGGELPPGTSESAPAPTSPAATPPPPPLAPVAEPRPNEAPDSIVTKKSREVRDGRETSAAQRQATQEEQTDQQKADVSGGGQQAAAGPGRIGKEFWALEGVSSLWINIHADDTATTFQSLGEQPELQAVVVDQRRIAAAAYGLALLVLLVGIGLTHRPLRDKAMYVAVVLLGSTVPLLLTTRFDEMGLVFDYTFYAGCALVGYFLVAPIGLAVYRGIKERLPAVWLRPPVTAIVLLAVALAVTAPTRGDDKHEDAAPVAVPANAIIVPYDPEKPREADAQQKILVPYARYVELWNLAHPDKRIETAPPPVGFAIAGTSYEATLGTGDFLPVIGRMQIDVFSDKPVSVPLHLGGGVLEKATVDGQAAKLQLVEPEGAAETARGVPSAVGNALRGVPGAANEPAPAAPGTAQRPFPTGIPPRLLLLHLSGKGRKSVELHVRLGLSRQGGWRIVRGHLPVGPAAALTLTAPTAGTEIRISGLSDRPSFDTTAANETIQTALAADGRLDVQWRPKVAEGMVDQALTARSLVAFDVREDSLRALWQVRLEFGRAFRDSFSLTAPGDYLVESVTGANVRGWTVKKEADQQRIDVTLLKPVQGSETLTLQLAKRGRVGQGELAEFDVPLIQVEGAALEQGEIAVRKSPRLDLRTAAAVSLTRADSGGQTTSIEQLADAADAAVLLVKPYQTFRFVKPPYRLSLAAQPMPQAATADVKAVLQLAERGTTLDAAITFRPEGQPLYQVRIYLPDQFTLERLGPADLEWAVTAENNRQLLTVQLLDGRTDQFTLTLLGKIATPPAPVAPAAALGDVPPPRSLPAPRLEILDVQKQEGEIVLVPDPDTDVRLDAVANAESAPLTAGPAWMKGEQQPLARAVLRHRLPSYAATVTLTPRTPIVSARSISNVKITARSIEETVLIDFQIEQAGIRRVSFLVPQHLAKARLKALLLKQKTVEAATGAAGAPPAGMVRIRLELQDYVRGKYSVLLEHDRLLSTGKQKIDLPVIETGRTDRRLVALENAGRDEVVIGAGDAPGLEPVSRQQQAWRELTAVLGENVTQAFAALPSAPQPSLSFQSQERKKVEVADASIDLATTLLVVDPSGAYRALVQYRVTNSKEQFLEITLPETARLWTATVAGEPVKPATPTGAIVLPGVVRIPLVKTAEGDGDYLVELKYGGKITMSSALGAVDFPLIRQTSINVEQSQVRLLLPESQQWFDFGGTMRLVADEEELQKGFQGYLQRRITEAAKALSSDSDFTKVRAFNNLKQSRLMFDFNKRYQSANNLRQLEIESQNEALLQRAEVQAQTELEQQQRRGEEADNRYRLNSAWSAQELSRSKNVVSELGSNFDGATYQASGSGKMKGDEALNPQWLDQNKLRTQTKEAGADAKPGGRPSDDGKSLGGRYFRGGRQPADEKDGQANQPQSGQKAPEIANKKQLDALQQKFEDEAGAREGRRDGGERAQQLRRYQENLEMQNAQPAQQPGNYADYGYSQGFGAGGAQMGGFRGQGQPQGGQPGDPARVPAGPGGGMGGPQGQFMPMQPPGVDPTAFAPNAPAPPGDAEAIAQVAAGLASLDVRLPQRGRLYRFTTPRGDLEIRARSVPVVTLQRLGGLAAVLAAAFLVWALAREQSRRIFARMFRWPVFAPALIAAGAISAIVGIFPWAGLAAVVAGVTLVIRRQWPARPATIWV